MADLVLGASTREQLFEATRNLSAKAVDARALARWNTIARRRRCNPPTLQSCANIRVRGAANGDARTDPLTAGVAIAVALTMATPTGRAGVGARRPAPAWVCVERSIERIDAEARPLFIFIGPRVESGAIERRSSRLGASTTLDRRRRFSRPGCGRLAAGRGFGSCRR